MLRKQRALFTEVMVSARGIYSIHIVLSQSFITVNNICGIYVGCENSLVNHNNAVNLCDLRVEAVHFCLILCCKWFDLKCLLKECL